MDNLLSIKLHVLSPVHIGCDEVYEPTGFVIDEKTGHLTAFDGMDLVRSLTQEERNRLTSICMQGTIASILALFQFIAGRKIKGRDIETARELPQHYQQVRKLSSADEQKIKQELSKFAISRTSYTPYDGLPYIPGSSLKGALRTAYLNMLAKEEGLKDFRGQARALEETLLGGSFATDPFRFVKVSDLMPAGELRAKIYYAVNKKKKESKYEARGPFQVVEAIKEGALLEGVLNVLTPLRMKEIKKPVSPETLLRSLHDFYSRILEQEEAATSEMKTGVSITARVREKFDGRLGESAFIVRMGRHSGAEAMTIDGFRSIKIMQGKGEQNKYLDRSTTLWFASEARKTAGNSGLIPFGWAVLEVSPLDVTKGIYTNRPDTRTQVTTKQVPEVPPVSLPETKPEPKMPVQTVCKDVILLWTPGNRTLTTTVDGKKAIADNIDRTFVPESLWPKLEKKKSVKATIVVEPMGNAFKIIKVENGH